jgi:hypothetical protein
MGLWEDEQEVLEAAIAYINVQPTGRSKETLEALLKLRRAVEKYESNE